VGCGSENRGRVVRPWLRTVGRIAASDPNWLDKRISGGRDLWELACGIDPRLVVPDREAKSIGAEDTFDEDLAGTDALLPHVHSQALRVGRRLRQAGRKTTVVQLKLKLADFTLLTRQTTLHEPTDDGQAIYRAASTLLLAEKLNRRSGSPAFQRKGFSRKVAVTTLRFRPPHGPAQRRARPHP